MKGYMVTGYLNTTKNSPITGAIICDTEILLYGKDGRTLSSNDASRIKNLFAYTDRKSKTKAVFVELENAEQAMYNESFTTKLFGFTKKLFGYVDNTSKNTAEPVKIEDTLQDWSIKRTKSLEDKANERYLFMKKFIDDKAQKAREENKKLLVVMGEEHKLTDPHFFQVLLLDICTTIGIENVLLELPSTEQLIPSKDTTSLDITIHHYFYQDLFSNVLSKSHEKTNISLHPIDPLHNNYGKRTVSPKTRDKSINQSIKEVDQDALCVVGGAHIPHITTDPELSEKYEYAIFHSANLAYVPHFKNASDTTLNKWLKIHQSSASKTEKNVSEQLNSPSNESESKKLDLDSEFKRYEASNRGQMYVMKSQMPEKIINLSLEDGTAKAIPSDTEALNIAATVIEQNNSQSKILIGLRALQNDYKQLQEIQDRDPIPLQLEGDYLSGKITEKEYNQYNSDDNVKNAQKNYMIWEFIRNKNVYSQSDDETSDKSDQEAQRSGINTDIDLTGNWDTWPDC